MYGREAMLVSAFSSESTTSFHQLRQWFAAPSGSRIFAIEAAMLEQLLPEFFGYHLAQFSVQSRPLFQSSQIRHKFCAGLDDVPGSDLVTSPAMLPFADDSLDVVLLHHLLDYVETPLEVLRELARVTLPMGHLVVIGFNPLSLWGAWQTLAQFTGKPPWDGRFIRTGRLMDWLNLLNFKIDRAQYAVYGLPSGQHSGPVDDYSQGFGRNLNLPVGSIYVIVAKKQVGAMTPIRPQWNTARSFGRLNVVRSARTTLRTSLKPMTEPVIHNTHHDRIAWQSINETGES